MDKAAILSQEEQKTLFWEKTKGCKLLIEVGYKKNVL